MNSTVVSAYMIGAIIFVICMLLAIASAQSIRYEAGINPQDKRKRKIAFWVLAILCPIAIISVTYFTVYCDIRIPSRQNAYIAAMGISSAIFFIAYIVCGFVLSKVFSHGKLASWF
mgnify:CR=1 FL=1